MFDDFAELLEVGVKTQLKQVIYVSEISDTSSDSLTNIYDISQKNNSKSGISGCLLIGSNSYLQLLEGPDSAVENLYSKIQMDSRHKKVKKLFEQNIEEKLFSSWSMKFAPFNNVEWDNKEFDLGKFQNISAATAVKVFQNIKKMIS